MADGLFTHAHAMPIDYGYNPDKPPPPAESLQRLVADDLAHTELWRAIVAFGNSAVAREQLLERFERLVKNYPESKHVKRAEETAILLRQMVKEDAEHAARRKAGRSFVEFSKKEQIAELIFQLRDQNGFQWTQPGRCDIFDEIHRKHDTPAHQLVEMGLDAVPQLIEALDDPRCTRSVEFHRNFYFSHHVLRVGDCSVAILERIAARDFRKGNHMTKDNGVPATRKAVKAWWEAIQVKGEKQWLIEATKRGDSASPLHAKGLLEKYPDEVLPAIVTGVKAAEERETREMLVAVACSIKDDSAVPFLLRELKEGPNSYGRVRAARSLHQRGRPEGVSAMIEQWQGGRAQSWPRRMGIDRDEEWVTWAVTAFLATCGKVEAIQALGKDLKMRSASLRIVVLVSFDGREALEPDPDSVDIYKAILPSTKGVLDDPEAVREAIERLLIDALDDNERWLGRWGSWHGKDYKEPRICDIAGHVLTLFAPKKYAFDPAVSQDQRDQGIAELKKTWRRAHGNKKGPS
jgi:hypothetical protein